MHIRARYQDQLSCSSHCLLVSEQADAGEAEIIPHLLAFHERVFASISLCLFLFFLHRIQEDVGLQRAHVQSMLSGPVSKLQDVGGGGTAQLISGISGNSEDVNPNTR